MKRLSDPGESDAARFQDLRHLMIYLDYAIPDVQKFSPIGANLLALVVSCLREEAEELDQQSPAKPMLS